MLERTKVAGKFKLYASDCGLLLSQYPTGAAMGVATGAGDADFGAVYENTVHVRTGVQIRGLCTSL